MWISQVKWDNVRNTYNELIAGRAGSILLLSIRVDWLCQIFLDFNVAYRKRRIVNVWLLRADRAKCVEFSMEWRRQSQKIII